MNLWHIFYNNLSEVADYLQNYCAKMQINERFPARVDYVIETNGKGFYYSAVKLDRYISENWGFSSGRVWLVRISKL